MDLENTMPAAPIDPQLELLSQGDTAESIAYPLSASFEPWNSMFESIGEFPQSTQDGGMMDSDLYSDTASSESYSFGNDQDAQFLMSPVQDSSINPDESPGNTSISTSLSESGASSNAKANASPNTNTSTGTKKNASKPTKSRKGHRRNRSETEKKEQVKQRNRVAASKCRQKKKIKVDELKDMQSSLEAQNNDLHQEYQRLRQEIGRVKSELINHTECNDPNIDRWVENEAKGYVQKLVQNEERQRMASISSSDGNIGEMQMQSFQVMPNMSSEDPYMGMN
ncbi:hypothetical protein ACHAQJ_000866 [Trichoderma viride]